MTDRAPESTGQRAYLIGVDLGGSSAKAVAVASSGEPFAQHTLQFDDTVPFAFARAVKGLVDRIEGEIGSKSKVIGISAPGLAHRDERSIAHMPGRLTGLEGYDWKFELGRDHPVPVLNDAHAALLGEHWLGAARGVDNVFMITLGTGVGGAAMVDGRLLRGAIGRAGHLGHVSLDLHSPSVDICGIPGSLENLVATCTIHERSAGRFQTIQALVAAVEQNDAGALAVWEDSLRALAVGIASLVNVLDPETVVVGGGVSRAGATLFEPLKRHLARYEWRPGGHAVRIVPAQLGSMAGAYGAAFNASANSDRLRRVQCS